MRYRTLANLRADVRQRADVEGFTGRHPDTQLTRYINESCQALREIVSEAGWPYYLTAENQTMTTGQGYVLSPDDFLRIYGFEVVDNGVAHEVLPMSFRDRTRYGGGSPSTTTEDTRGRPLYYDIHAPWTGVSDEGMTIHLYPTPDSDYSYSLRYLPVFTDLSADADNFNGIAGWEEWVVLDAAIKVVTKDKDVNGNYKLLATERERVERRIRETAPKQNRGGPVQRVDTRNRHSRPGADDYLRRW